MGPVLRAIVTGLLASTASAQSFRGVVRDSVSREPIAGVVITMLDSSGTTVGRTLTGANGTFSIALPASLAKIRLARIGYRPWQAWLGADVAGGEPINLQLARLPSLLDPVNVLALAKCDKRRADDRAQALLLQARAGLLATIVARESNPGKFVRLAYERTLEGHPDSIAPSVRIDSVSGTSTTFTSLRRGVDLVRKGFTADSFGTGIYFGPDAEALLDEGFEAGYCFRVIGEHPRQPSQIGLAFAPAASPRIGRVDIEGVLWIDTTVRALRDLEYRYVGLGKDADERNVGGSLTYQEMPNGSVIVSRWSVRLLKVRVDSVQGRNTRMANYRLVVSDGGGVVARATWPDGTTWAPSLASVEITAVTGDGRQPVPRASVRLRNTDYVATADSNGVATFRDVLPGRYTPLVVSAELAAYGFFESSGDLNVVAVDSTVIRGSRVRPEASTAAERNTVVARAGATVRRVARLLTASELASQRCGSPLTSRPKRVIIGQVTQFNLTGVEDASVHLGTLPGVATGPAGTFVVCVPDALDAGEVTLTVRRGREVGRPTTLRLSDSLTFVSLRWSGR